MLDEITTAITLLKLFQTMGTITTTITKTTTTFIKRDLERELGRHGSNQEEAAAEHRRHGRCSSGQTLILAPISIQRRIDDDDDERELDFVGGGGALNRSIDR